MIRRMGPGDVVSLYRAGADFALLTRRQNLEDTSSTSPLKSMSLPNKSGVERTDEVQGVVVTLCSAL